MDIKPPSHGKKHHSRRQPSEPDGTAPAKTEALSPEPGGSWRSTASFILLICSALAIAALLTIFGLQSYEVDGQSMETTLQNQDRLIVDKVPRTWSRITGHPYIPKRGDIIVFNESGLFDANGLAEKQLIKRVIGLPGDHVVIGDGKITIYNAQHPGGFDPDTNLGYKITEPTNPTGNFSNVTLGPDQIFVCGDNRTNSEDSRAFGPIFANQIVGQLVLRITPLNNAERF
jgi:signal peptidase I